MLEQDTICAVSTPAGAGGIGIIRLSGAAALAVASKIFRPKKACSLGDAASHTIHYGRVVEPATGEIVDEALASVMRAPSTYTREDVVEINCHGGMVALRRTMELLVAAGARAAEPGEFTRRAFLNGRIDLAQAEAVMDVINARTELGLRAANEQLAGGLSREISELRERLADLLAGLEAGIDFPEDEVDPFPEQGLEDGIRSVTGKIDGLLAGSIYGRIMREGCAAAIVGRPNVGKSSLLNALLRQDRAIVTEHPGTTRDVLEESLNIGGMPLRVLDTAGIRDAGDVVEQEGVRRSIAAIGSADIVLIVLDGSCALTAEDRRVLDQSRGKAALAVVNKSDLPRRLEKLPWPDRSVEISCLTGRGLDELRSAIPGLMNSGAVRPRVHAWAVNQRHKRALEQARESLERALASFRSHLSPEFIALDLREALDSVGLIVGATHTEDILARIFSDFCIGK